MSWAFANSIFQFFEDFWLAKLKSFFEKARQKAQNYLKSKVVMSILQNDFQAILSSDTNSLGVWKWNFYTDFFTFFYTNFWESDSKSGSLYQQCIEKDIAWSIAWCLPDEENRMSKLKRDIEKKIVERKYCEVDSTVQNNLFAYYSQNFRMSWLQKIYWSFGKNCLISRVTTYIRSCHWTSIWTILHLLWKQWDVYSNVLPLRT